MSIIDLIADLKIRKRFYSFQLAKNYKDDFKRGWYEGRIALCDEFIRQLEGGAA